VILLDLVVSRERVPPRIAFRRASVPKGIAFGVGRTLYKEYAA